MKFVKKDWYNKVERNIMNEYTKRLYQEYNRDPEGFEKKSAMIKEHTKEIAKAMNHFGKEVDEFLEKK